MKLSDQVLEAIGKESSKTSANKNEKRVKQVDKPVNSIKFNHSNENDLTQTTISDFIPVKTFS